MLARKALSTGQIKKARTLACSSLQSYPTLWARDARAFVTFGLIAAESTLPERLQGYAYSLAHRAMQRYYKRYNAGEGPSRHSTPQEEVPVSERAERN